MLSAYARSTNAPVLANLRLVPAGMRVAVASSAVLHLGRSWDHRTTHQYQGIRSAWLGRQRSLVPAFQAR
eukprot:2613743-Rhodomonas_salina.2